jgi:hypothetical protein
MSTGTRSSSGEIDPPLLAVDHVDHVGALTAAAGTA